MRNVYQHSWSHVDYIEFIRDINIDIVVPCAHELIDMCVNMWYLRGMLVFSMYMAITCFL